MLQRCHSVNCLLQEWGCSCRDRCQPGPSRQLLSTATWTLQSRPDMRSFSYLTIRARDGAPLFRVGEIFRCHSGGCSQSLVRDTVKTPVRMQCCSRRDSLIRCAGVGEPVQRKHAIKDVGHLSLLHVAVGGGRRFLRTTPVLTRAQVGRVPIPPIMRAVRLLILAVVLLRFVKKLC